MKRLTIGVLASVLAALFGVVRFWLPPKATRHAARKEAYAVSY